MSNDFDFILSDAPKQRGPAFLQSSKQRMLAMGGFIGVVIIIVVLILNIAFGSSGPTAATYVPVYGWQQEMLRILENREDLTDSSLKSKYEVLYLAVLSDSKNSESYFAEFGYEVEPEKLAVYGYTDLESDLEQAAAINRFDSEFESYIDKAMNDYISELLAITPTEAQTPILNQAKTNIALFKGPVEE